MCDGRTWELSIWEREEKRFFFFSKINAFYPKSKKRIILLPGAKMHFIPPCGVERLNHKSPVTTKNDSWKFRPRKIQSISHRVLGFPQVRVFRQSRILRVWQLVESSHESIRIRPDSHGLGKLVSLSLFGSMHQLTIPNSIGQPESSLIRVDSEFNRFSSRFNRHRFAIRSQIQSEKYTHACWRRSLWLILPSTTH